MSEKIQAKTENVEKTEKQSTKFYPDIAFNRKERSKTVVMASILILLMGGMGVTILLGGMQNEGGSLSYISGAITLVCVIFAVCMIPSAFKQYPVKEIPLIEIKPRELIVNGTSIKPSDVIEVRLTYTVDAVGKKEDNQKMLESLADKEPPKNTTANVDFYVKEPNGKTKTLYTTVANSYEAIIALFSSGIKHYSIVYAMKKQAIKSTYDLNSTQLQDGSKLSELSKKQRLKQLF